MTKEESVSAASSQHQSNINAAAAKSGISV